MKQAILISLISLLFLGDLFPDIPEKTYSKESCFTPVLNNAVDSNNLNPYLKIIEFDLDIYPPSTGVQLYRNGLLYLSSSKEYSGMIPKHISFGNTDLYFAELNDSVLNNPTSFFLNEKLNIPADGICFTTDYSKLFYTKLSENDGKLKIFLAESISKTGNPSWEFEDKPLGFCKEYNYSHPTVSNEGDIMIFSSDMPGGKGGMDLYLCRFENNEWSEPENMGDRFNTEGNEMYACFDQVNNLYFSSNGIPGIGGYDIFISNYNGSDWNNPVNLYEQINTSKDELAFKVNKTGGNFGFYTVQEKSGKGRNNVIRQVYKLELDDKYSNDDSFLLSFVLDEYAHEKLAVEQLRAENLAKQQLADQERKADSIKAEQLAAVRLAEKKRKADSLSMANLEAEKLASEQRKADSARAARLEDEKLAAEKKRADSIKAAQIMATRLAAEKRRADSIKIAELEAERLENEKRRADSLRTAQLEKERLAAEQRRADSIRLAELEAEKLLAEKRRTDSIKAAQTRQQEESVASDKVIYRVQCASSMKSIGSKTITMGGKEYDTYSYFYKGAWRVTIGEFDNLEDARTLRNLCRKAGYNQAFIAAFKNGARSLDMSLFQK